MPPLSLFVKTIEKVIRLCTVLISFFFSGGREDRDILWAFFYELSIESFYLSPELREKWPYLQNYQPNFCFNTVHNLIIFSI